LRRVRRHPGLTAASTLAVLSLLALAAVLLLHRAVPARPPVPDRARPRRAFAVIGLKNASARPESAWVGTALAEMLTTEMGAGGQLRIVPAEQVARAVRALRVPEADALALDTLTRVRASLGADTVLVGSYLVLGPEPGATVRLDLRLQETGSGDTLAVAAEEGPVAALTDLAARAGGRLRAALGLPARPPAPEAAAASP